MYYQRKTLNVQWLKIHSSKTVFGNWVTHSWIITPNLKAIPLSDLGQIALVINGWSSVYVKTAINQPTHRQYSFGFSIVRLKGGKLKMLNPMHIHNVRFQALCCDTKVHWVDNKFFPCEIWINIIQCRYKYSFIWSKKCQ